MRDFLGWMILFKMKNWDRSWFWWVFKSFQKIKFQTIDMEDNHLNFKYRYQLQVLKNEGLIAWYVNTV